MIRRISVVLLTVPPALMLLACSPKTAGVGMDARTMSPTALMSLVRAGGDKLVFLEQLGSEACGDEVIPSQHQPSPYNQAHAREI